MLTASNLLIILVSTLGSVTYGYSSSIISTTLGQPSFLAYFSLLTRSNSSALTTCIVTLSQLGGLFGVLSISFLADKFGRKGLLAIAAVSALICFGLQAGSVSIGMFITFRTLGGIPVGQFLSGVPLFIGELAPPNIRGGLMNLHGVTFAIGYIIASWGQYGFSKWDHSYAWRVPLAIQGAFPLLLLFGLFILPESPRWLVMKGRNEEALAVLKRIHGGSASNLAYVEREFELMVEAEKLERTLNVSYATLFATKSNRKRAFQGWLTCFQYPALGTLVVANYLPTLLEGLKMAADQQLLLSAGYITVSPFGNLISCYLIDRLGRRKMLLLGSITCTACLIAETIVLAQGLGSRGGRITGVFFLFLQLFLFACFQDGVTFVYSSEIWPTHLRAKGFAFSMTGFFIGSTLFLGVSFTAFKNINYWFYLIFIVTASIITVIIALFWIETNKVPLEVVAKLFGDEAVFDPLAELQQKEEGIHVEEKVA